MGMVEKVGLAIDAAAIQYIAAAYAKAARDNEPFPNIGMADVPVEVFALAALKAMREPTEEMIASGAQRASGFASAGNRMCNGYRAMIDKAIQESGE